MALTLDDLCRSPDHYLHSFEGDAALFVPMDRAAYQRSIFLDARISAAANGTMRLPLATLGGAAPQAQRTAWVMHVAHCGSTLLARALDTANGSLVLREPQALRQIAVGQQGAPLPLTLALLSKRYRADAPTMIKGNVPINFLLPQIAALDPAAPMLLLYLPLRDYLLAILRDEDHRAWLRRVTGLLAPHLESSAQASDAERAAALWLAQIEIYAGALAGSGVARSLDAEVFFAEPLAVLGAAAAHLQMPMTAADLSSVVDGPLFATYSKNPDIVFDNSARLTRKRETEPRLVNDLAAAERWLAPRSERVRTALDAIEAGRLEI